MGRIFETRKHKMFARYDKMAKAFTRIGMGRCQGRVCGAAAAEIMAAHLQCPIDQVGRVRAQPPVKPIPIRSEAQAQ